MGEGRADARWRRRGLWVAVVVVCVALTGCRGGRMDLTVHGDGSGTVAIEVHPDAATLERLEHEDLHFVVDEVTSSDDVEVSELGEGNRRGQRVEVRFDDVDELSKALVSTVTVLDHRVQLFQRFDVVDLHDEWRLEAVVNPIGAVTGAGSTDELDSLVEAARDVAGPFTGHTGLELTIALPGKVTSSNAASVDGGRATWDLASMDAPTRLTMRSEPSEFPTTAQLVVGGGAALLVLGLLLTGWAAIRPKESARTRRRRDRELVFTTPVSTSSGWGPPDRSPIAAGPGSVGGSGSVGWSLSVASPGSVVDPGGAATGSPSNPLPPLGQPVAPVSSESGAAESDSARSSGSRVPDPASPAAAADRAPSESAAPAWAAGSPGTEALDPTDVAPPGSTTGRRHDLPAPEARPTIVRGSGMIMGRDEPMIIEPDPAAVPGAGWYPDPVEEGRLRYWDGQAWTDRVG